MLSVRGVCGKPKLTAEPVASVRIDPSRDVEPAPQHPVLGSEHGKVGKRVPLVAVGTRASGKGSCDFPAHRCSPQRSLVAYANALNRAAGLPM